MGFSAEADKIVPGRRGDRAGKLRGPCTKAEETERRTRGIKRRSGGDRARKPRRPGAEAEETGRRSRGERARNQSRAPHKQGRTWEIARGVTQQATLFSLRIRGAPVAFAASAAFMPALCL